MQQPLGKREENKAKVRQNLLQEAQLLFATKGFAETTVADIVKAAGIGRGTFYNYFTDVKDIFDAVIEHMNVNIQTNMLATRKEADNFYEFLYLSFKSYFDFVSTKEMSQFHKKNYAYIRRSYRSPSVRQMVADMQAEFKTRKQVGGFKEDYEFKLLSFVLVGVPAELFINLHYSEMTVSNEQLATFLAKMFTKILEK